jgi:hypothetical protein
MSKQISLGRDVRLWFLLPCNLESPTMFQAELDARASTSYRHVSDLGIIHAPLLFLLLGR